MAATETTSAPASPSPTTPIRAGSTPGSPAIKAESAGMAPPLLRGNTPLPQKAPLGGGWKEGEAVVRKTAIAGEEIPAALAPPPIVHGHRDDALGCKPGRVGSKRHMRFAP